MAFDNLAQFNKEIDDFAKKLVPQQVTLLQKKIILEALRRIVMKTPVDTGRAKGNWQVTIGAATEQALLTTDADGSETIAAGLAVVAQIPPYSVVWISNNVTYIEFLEDGSSQQAPEGMVALTIAELQTMFEGKQL